MDFPRLISMVDGTTATLLKFDDLIPLVREKMGDDAATALQLYVEETEEDLFDLDLKCKELEAICDEKQQPQEW